jgi:uncharacterized protein with NAD-binding domain and iron-sulfur cluster
MGSEGKRRVAVLGGGVGGITAAFELTKTPELRERFDVSVYQLGWRLGGKGASGRNEARGQRIEEHGLHIWFAFYRNAFRMMEEAYAELGRPAGAPLATIDRAFEPCPKITLYDLIGGEWRALTAVPPRLGDDPWRAAGDRLPDVREVARLAAGWAADAVVRIPGAEISRARELLLEAERVAAASQQQEGLPLDLAEVALGQVAGIVRRAREALEEDWRERLLSDPRARFVYTAVDVIFATAKGFLADDVLRKGLHSIDHWDWAEWLGEHGASKLTVGESPATRAPILRAVYDVAFCFPKGVVDDASAAAGTAIGDLIKMTFGYRGAFAYKMTAGMGDAIFAPLYEVLRSRGVDFRFFTAVTRIAPDPSGTAVGELEVVSQADLGDLRYEPLEDVDGLPCWPRLPRGDQLPSHAARAGTRFETELDPLGRRRSGDLRTERRGEDFDDVVLAIPVGALPQIAAPLCEVNDEFAAMVKRGAEDTVRTQAFQLWTRRSPTELGQAHGSDSVAACFVEPLDTYCDMGQTLWSENHPGGVGGVSYVCGVLEDRDGETRDEATERVKRNASEYVERDLRHLWPAASESIWDELHDPGDGNGPARMDAQYWRANTAPWERYVITPAGNTKTRLESGKSGFDNLVLAGDWTKTPINGGCVEAAVISGMQAAQALTGEDEPIIGEDDRWLTPS